MGFLFRQRCVKVCQYADDTSIIVLSDVALHQVFTLFQRYELASGAKLNVMKSHGLLVGHGFPVRSFPSTSMVI